MCHIASEYSSRQLLGRTLKRWRRQRSRCLTYAVSSSIVGESHVLLTGANCSRRSWGDWETTTTWQVATQFASHRGVERDIQKPVDGRRRDVNPVDDELYRVYYWCQSHRSFYCFRQVAPLFTFTVVHGSLSSHESSSYAASRSVHPFLQGSRWRPMTRRKSTTRKTGQHPAVSTRWE